MTAQAGQLASSLQGEPDCVLVVVDFPAAGSSLRGWEAVAAAVAEDERALRLFPAESAGEITLPAAQWLADRISRPVCYPDGVMPAGSSGLVFLPPAGSKGWAVCVPGQAPNWRGRRFPVPEWEEPANSSPHRVGRSATAEPLPAGLWIRSDGSDSWLEAGRAKLTRWLSVSPRELTVVLGAHGVPPLSLADVARWWVSLPPGTRAKVRFFCFGEFLNAGKVSPGQALADALGEEVVCHGGFPAGRPDAPMVFALRQDGSHGVRMFAEQLAFRPRRDPAAGAEPPAPRVRRSQPPGGGLTESEPGVYRHASGAVVEVVQAGLWLRAADVPAHATAIRTTPPEPTALLVFHDPADDRLMAGVLDQLDDKVRAVAKPVPVTAPAEPPRTPFGSGADLTMPLTPLPRLSRLLQRAPVSVAAPAADQARSGLSARLEPQEDITLEDDAVRVTTKIRHPAVKPRRRGSGAAPRAARAEAADERPGRQQAPDPQLRVWPAPAGFTAEPAMVRTGRETAFDALSDRVGAVMRRFSPHRPVPESGLTAAVAAGLYLAGEDPDVDAGLRTGTAGPHVDFGRCVAGGLQKLPPHRKATATVLAPGPGLWELLETGTVLREWGFFHARTVLGPVESGSTDLIVWSLTGRLTTSIEPAEGGVADRVVFPPGTAFKVLEAREPDDVRRGRILLRELTAAEAGENGEAADRDDLVRAALQTFADRGTRAVDPVPAAQAGRLGRLPGVVDALTGEE
ncbi:hypothetical protein QRX60_29510 [Amycolatopsis mongoliensis]|uniref:Uncharacterized protein n=1 Tax=Amycolatopsis mongoliensis TaxID=715475 RepID=A0A9Y2JJV7_9PSEU|nr:hypothetical protein [Amycolatopsis sp. 4-36]WIX98203.1 hypothetical protein QRX60_29510 [Amycolatopsis sp. 4-36]